ncbi:Abi family protein [Erysipelotrichaceae bacterium OttesenSCG-928-M19]|nr:Abi family protein [Erysipelotrichaceae bacterium OttesenSCG-928-M19]
MSYKKILSLDEKIKYLHDNKKIRFNIIKEDEAKEILLHNNYINVITPFKDRFCEGGKKDKNTNKHIYKSEIDFSEYYTLYQEEIERSKIMLHNILLFERQFNAIYSYYILQHFKIEDDNNFDNYILFLKTKCQHGHVNPLIKNENQAKKIIENIEKLESDFYDYKNIFVTLDRVSIGTLKDLYICSPEEVQKKVFKEMSKSKKVFGTTNYYDFIEKLFDIVGIRNVLAHNNSISIFIKYYNVKGNILRKNKKSILSIIKDLQK